MSCVKGPEKGSIRDQIHRLTVTGESKGAGNINSIHFLAYRGVPCLECGKHRQQGGSLFESTSLAHGSLWQWPEDAFPSSCAAWDQATLELEENATHFGFVMAGPARLEVTAGEFTLGPGMFFSAPGACKLSAGQGFVASRLGYGGFFYLGGPVEDQGRLRYIDGCSDSLLIPPVVWGDPCLNLLVFPPRIDQTLHTHPSLRLGGVILGQGRCVLEDREVPLQRGTLFAIPSETVHAFRTGDQGMAIIAYHPDSDFGPRHQDHPMINRTMVSGQSARYLDHIHTPAKAEVSP